MSTRIPQSIEEDVVSVLRGADTTLLVEIQDTAPGGVSETLLLKTQTGTYFLKWNETPWFGTFTNEAFQLSLLRQSNTVHVPDVIGFAEGEEGRPAWMLQKWVGSAKESDKPERVGAKLGERIAALHRATLNSAPGYGYVGHNDDNTANLPTQDWAFFLYEAHLRHHIEKARNENRWTPERNQRVDKIVERLPDLLSGVERAPAMLHGDLHSGNVRLEEGEPVVVDPWLFYGDREIEIVSTLMSGDFTSEFYEAYNANFPLAAGFNERADLYKLVWLLSGMYYSTNPASGEDNAVADPILARYGG